MRLTISPTDGIPIYLQIVNQVKYLIASGRLSAEDELPPIRALAEQLLVNPNTVARAYRELEQAGIVYKRRTAGTFVSSGGSPLARSEQIRILTQRADALLVESRQLGFETREVIGLLVERDRLLQEVDRIREETRDEREEHAPTE